MKKLTKRQQGALLFVAVVFAIVVKGCSGTDYHGVYTESGKDDGKGKTIRLESGSPYIIIAETVDGDHISGSGKVESSTKSADGKTVTLQGSLNYSGGSGTSFGVTVAPGQERHWTSPFTASINLEMNTISFQGSLIVDSQTTRPWNVTLIKVH
jgi:hypothetical protein